MQQDNKPTYTKLKDLVDDDFTVQDAYGYTWKKWDEAAKRMLISERFEPGYRKIYAIDTDRGKLELGPGQLSSLLEAVYHKGKADINGRTFHVKSNGKTGMDIRYYFNAVKQEQTLPLEGEEEPIDPEDIPF